MKVLLDMISDDAGNVSSTRVVMLISFTLVLTGWLVISIQLHALQNLPESVLALLAVTMGGKVAQKFSEAAATNVASSSAPPNGAAAPSPAITTPSTDADGTVK
jgi:hypothetical protein